MAGKKLSITLPVEFYDRLEELSKITGLKKTALIIEAINSRHGVKMTDKKAAQEATA